MLNLDNLSIDILKENFKDYKWSDISNKTPMEIIVAIQLCWEIPSIALLIKKNDNNKSIFGKFFMEELSHNIISKEIDVIILNKDNYVHFNKKSKNILTHISKNLFSKYECQVCLINCNETLMWTCSQCTTNLCNECLKNIMKFNNYNFKCPVCKIDCTRHLTKSELENIIKENQIISL